MRETFGEMWQPVNSYRNVCSATVLGMGWPTWGACLATIGHDRLPTNMRIRISALQGV